MGTGSEVHIAIEAEKLLLDQGIKTRVISVPCHEIFDQQDHNYIQQVFDNHDNAIMVAIEAGVRQCWDKYIGRDGIFVGMEDFGASAPAEDLYKHFKITTENVVQMISNKIKDKK